MTLSEIYDLLSQKKYEEVVDQLRILNEAYRKGDPLVTDPEWDKLYEDVRSFIPEFNKDVDVEKYSAPYKRPKSRKDADHDNNDGSTVPLHGSGQKSLDTLKFRYLIIPYTEEREEYLKEIQKTFITVTDKLNEFLKDLTQEKLDHLIATSPVMKLLQSPQDEK